MKRVPRELAPWARLGLLCLPLCASAIPVSAAPPTLTFDRLLVTASGMTASGKVAFLGVMRLPRVYFQEVYAFREVTEANASGAAVLAVEPEVGIRSVWAAVD